ncbi:MAG: type II secretion system protein M [Shewanella sp.]|nr:type II secretion system protein M [Shewanella sp.]MCF1430549.1 type II secretion system protein M [Shewanella sp.]MCF1437647.1 type II secretion system protein M [Shewanella sp.]MCF1459153.1 type II secretion system protein M [Shewanella sp.]
MDNIKIWWAGLAPREQQMLSAAAIVVLIGVLYWGIWTPIANAQQGAQRQLQAEQRTLAYVKQTASKITSLRQKGGKAAFSGSLSAEVNSTAGKYRLEITRMQPQGNKIQLWMDDVPFDVLMDYLNELVQQGLALDNLDVSATDKPGYVQVRRIQLSH